MHEVKKKICIELLQEAQSEIAQNNGTIGVDTISNDEMDIQHAINVIQKL